MTWVSSQELLEKRKNEIKDYKLSTDFSGHNPDGAKDVSAKIEERKNDVEYKR